MANDFIYDVTAIGTPIVDIISMADKAFLQEHKLNMGSMTLIDKDTSNHLFEASGPVTQQSGGSAANTIAGIASFGGRCAFIGRALNDETGKVFQHDMHALNVKFDFCVDDNPEGQTARCIIFVTEDGERTMATYLGVGTELAPDDLDMNAIRNAKITYMEGYLFDGALAKEAYHAAALTAHMAGREVALTLSDPFCVQRHRDDFKKLIAGHIDILFANEVELLSLYETDNLEEAITRVSADVRICAVTLGAKGAIILTDKDRVDIAAEPVAKVIDTTGAGDMFAAGFLYAYTRGMSSEDCGKLGAKAAAKIIVQVGARPSQELKTLLAA